ncbi:hypothetical protein GYA19_01870 [Candidatus Beckwithbacteria bacterium]|nr:hypothetical protein [Candidatus Beckwithbacteria bacterium]
MKKINFVLLSLVLLSFTSCTLLDKAKQITQKNYSGNLQGAIALGVPLKCTFKINDDGQQMENISYIKGKKYSGQIEQDGKKTNVVLVDECMWSWSDEEKKGIKTCFDQIQDKTKDESEGSEPAENKSVWDDLGNLKNEQINCSPALFGDEKFAVPKDIEFMNMDNFLEDMQNWGEELEGSDSSLPEEVEDMELDDNQQVDDLMQEDNSEEIGEEELLKLQHSMEEIEGQQ